MKKENNLQNYQKIDFFIQLFHNLKHLTKDRFCVMM